MTGDQQPEENPRKGGGRSGAPAGESGSLRDQGAGIRWNIWDWDRSRSEATILEQQKQLLRSRRAAFDRQLESRMVQEKARIAQYRETLALDAQVLALQKEIADRAGTGLENGTLTATDYLIELNKENQARNRFTTHQLQLIQSLVNYRTLQGKL